MKSLIFDLKPNIDEAVKREFSYMLIDLDTYLKDFKNTILSAKEYMTSGLKEDHLSIIRNIFKVVSESHEYNIKKFMFNKTFIKSFSTLSGVEVDFDTILDGNTIMQEVRVYLDGFDNDPLLFETLSHYYKNLQGFRDQIKNILKKESL